MKKLDILNCGASGRVVFDFVCPNQWDNMETTDSERKRYCLACHRDVYHCHNADEAALRIEQGECIAVPSWLAKGAREFEKPRFVIAGFPKTIHNILTEIVQAKTDRAKATLEQQNPQPSQTPAQDKET